MTEDQTHLSINFDDVPDEILPVPAGVYECEIYEVPTLEENRKKDGVNLVVKMKIVNEGDSNGRVLTDFIPVKSMQTKIKNLGSSAGITMGSSGLHLPDLLGKVVRCVVKNRTYKNDEGEVVETANVREYLFAKE
jgi:hypothetical protein